MSDRVSIKISAHVAHVTLTRSDKMNALDPTMFEAICGAIDELKTLPNLRVVVVSGEGRGFCAGLDLSNFENDSEPMDLMPRTHGLANMPQQIAWGWHTLPVPVIAAAYGVHRRRTQYYLGCRHTDHPPGYALRSDGNAVGLDSGYGGIPFMAWQRT